MVIPASTKTPKLNGPCFNNVQISPQHYRGFIPTLDMRPSLDCKHKVLKSLGNGEGFENKSYYFTGARVTPLLKKPKIKDVKNAA